METMVGWRLTTITDKLVSFLLLTILLVRTFCRKRRPRLENDLVMTFW